MMINKRLIGTVSESKKYIAGNVACQWISLAANITMMGAIAHLLQRLLEGEPGNAIADTAMIAVIAVIVRFLCAVLSSRMSYLSSKTVKKTLREMIYRKLLRLGASYKEQANTSEVVQVAVEGVDQLETYFGAYLPQFFYAMLAPLTLFTVLSFISLPAAVVLLVCVPLIPVTIIIVQRWAKKLLSKYWSQYTALGDTFLENLQGLTTTKIYQSDSFKHQEMNKQSEPFRKITMKVLTMQLNSITIMDLIAYGGAALGVILAAGQFRAGHVDLAGCLMIILLAADFFLPMRMLGSFFHIAMNGMAASDKIFRLLDLPEPEQKNASVPVDCSIECRDLNFSYDAGREILHGVAMTFPKGSFTAIVGESGCGKSTNVAGFDHTTATFTQKTVEAGATTSIDLGSLVWAKNNYNEVEADVTSYGIDLGKLATSNLFFSVGLGHYSSNLGNELLVQIWSDTTIVLSKFSNVDDATAYFAEHPTTLILNG